MTWKHFTLTVWFPQSDLTIQTIKLVISLAENGWMQLKFYWLEPNRKVSCCFYRPLREGKTTLVRHWWCTQREFFLRGYQIGLYTVFGADVAFINAQLKISYRLHFLPRSKKAKCDRYTKNGFLPAFKMGAPVHYSSEQPNYLASRFSASVSSIA